MLIVGTAQAQSLRGFSQTCTDVDYKAGELSAKCQTIDGENTRSSIDLNSYIASYDGDLVWSREGGYVNTFNDCKIQSIPLFTSRIVSLSCDARKIDGRNSIATVVLDEHIVNVDGQLQYQ